MSKRDEIQDGLKNSISESIDSLTTADKLQVLSNLFNHISSLLDQGVLDYVDFAAKLSREQEREVALKEYIEIIISALKDSPNLKRDIDTLRKDLRALMTSVDDEDCITQKIVDKDQLEEYKKTARNISMEDKEVS